MDLSSIDISSIRKVVTRMKDEDHDQEEPVAERVVDTDASGAGLGADGQKSVDMDDDEIANSVNNSPVTDEIIEDEQHEARTPEHELGLETQINDADECDSLPTGDGDVSNQDGAVRDLTEEAVLESTGELLHVEDKASNEIAENQDDTDKSSTDADADLNKETSEQLYEASPDASTAEPTVDDTNQTKQTDETKSNQQLNATNADSTVNNTNITPPESPSAIEDDDDEPSQKILVDYASKVSGGQILEKSPSLKGTSNLLTGDIDRYAIAPCQDKKYVVIGLSEDILVKIIKLANYERYSSHVKEFQVLASQEYPTSNDQWTDLGTYKALSKSGEQTFELKEPAWARYLKFKFLSHYGVEHYCTVSQIKVHGSTMLQGFHEQWIESEKMDRDAGEDWEGEGGEDSVGEEQTEESDEVETEQHDDSLKEDASADSAAGTAIEETSDDQPSGEIEIDSTAADSDNGEGEHVSDSLQTEKVAKVNVASHDTNFEAVEEGNSRTQSDGGAADLLKSNKDDADKSIVSEASNEAISTSTGSDAEQRDVPNEDKPSSDELVKESSTRGEKNTDQKKGTTPDNATVDVPESLKDSKPNTEKNVTTHGMADVVKAAVSEATDAIKHAVQSADAVKEIKKMIRTTIAVIEEDGRTEHDILDDTNYTIGEANTSHEAIELAEEVESDNKSDEHGQSISEDTNSSGVNDSKSRNVTLLKENHANSTDSSLNTTIKDSDNSTHKNNGVKSLENTNEVGMKKSSNNGTTVDPSKPQSTTSTTTTMKVEPTATHPKKRDTISAASSDQIAKFLSRYPNASCIKGLDFQSFKAKTVVSHTVPGAAVGGGAPKMEPIFQKLTSEIKSVQTTQHQYEQFISAIKTCYEKVFADMANDLDTMQSKFDARLTLLEMLLLEKSDRPQSQTLYGFSVSTNFPLSAISTLFPFPMIFNSSEGVFMCMAILVFFVLMRRMKRTMNARDTIVTNQHPQESEIVHAATKAEIPAEKECDSDDICSPLPFHTVKNGFYSTNLPTDISHDISCEVSVDSSQPSLSRSEPIGTAYELNTPPSARLKKGSQRNRFRIKRRTKSEGTKTP